MALRHHCLISFAGTTRTARNSHENTTTTNKCRIYARNPYHGQSNHQPLVWSWAPSAGKEATVWRTNSRTNYTTLEDTQWWFYCQKSSQQNSPCSAMTSTRSCRSHAQDCRSTGARRSQSHCWRRMRCRWFWRMPRGRWTTRVVVIRWTSMQTRASGAGPPTIKCRRIVLRSAVENVQGRQNIQGVLSWGHETRMVHCVRTDTKAL